jgi:hypothetical protein
MEETYEVWEPTEEEIQSWLDGLNDYAAREWMETEVW